MKIQVKYLIAAIIAAVLLCIVATVAFDSKEAAAVPQVQETEAELVIGFDDVLPVPEADAPVSAN